MSKACHKHHSSGCSPKPSGGCKKVAMCGNTQIEYVDDGNGGCGCSKSHKNGITKIIAEIDIGFGNTLYIRGAGRGLSWDNGIAMKNQDANFWSFEIPDNGKDFEYKLLINDDAWSTGENFVAQHGTQNIVSPKF